MGIFSWGEDEWAGLCRYKERQIEKLKKRTVGYWKLEVKKLEKELTYFKKRLGEEKTKLAKLKGE